MKKFSIVRKYLTLTGLSFLAFLSVSPAWGDQVLLKNGDRVTGSIVKKDGKNLTIKADQFGVITTSWDQVESIRADKPVNVVLQDGRTAQGTLGTADGRIEVATQTAKLSVTPAEITTIRDADEQRAYERLQRPGWGQLWAGTGSVGLAGTSGNARTLTFTTGINAARVTRTDKASLYFNTIKASALVNGQNTDTAEAVRGGIPRRIGLCPGIPKGSTEGKSGCILTLSCEVKMEISIDRTPSQQAAGLHQQEF